MIDYGHRRSDLRACRPFSDVILYIYIDWTVCAASLYSYARARARLESLVASLGVLCAVCCCCYIIAVGKLFGFVVCGERSIEGGDAVYAARNGATVIE